MHTMRRQLRHEIPAGVAALLAALLGCQAPASSGPDQVASADVPRITNPDVPEGAVGTLVADTTKTACDLYHQVQSLDRNMVFSPLSVNEALAMAFAGARGQTAAQMAEALHFTLPPAQLAPAFNRLDLTLKAADTEGKGDDEAFTLHMVNRLWTQEGLALREEFLTTLAQQYGAAVGLLDFVHRAEAARAKINAWVEEQTRGRIKDLLPPGSITQMTRLVITNAVYFKATWHTTFEARATHPAPFRQLDGHTVDVPTMHESAQYAYAETGGCRAIDLPYRGGMFSMLILLPDDGTFPEFTRRLEPARLERIVAALERRQVALALPKFTFAWDANLESALTHMGMPRAFQPDEADFSGMTTEQRLFINTVQHKAFVAVDEKGTEAAAATAIGLGATAMPAETIELNIDRPFVFLIRHRPTGLIVFLGQVVDPTAK